MAVLGVMTTEFDAPVFGATSFEDVVALTARHGIATVQLQLGSVIRDVPTASALLHGLDVLGPRLDDALARESADVLRAYGVEIAAVDGTYNLIHPDENHRARNLDHLIALIELAPVFGTSVVTLCTGTRADVMWTYHPTNQDEDAWQDLLAQLRVAVPVAERAGITLAFEPEHNNVVDSAHRARRLMDEIGSPALKVLMDGANLFHRGDLARMRDHLDEAFALVGSDIVLAHAKDLDHDGDAGGRAAGSGLLDYGHYLAGLQACGFDGAIVLHQLGELGRDVDRAFDHGRRHAPAGYLSGAS